MIEFDNLAKQLSRIWGKAICLEASSNGLALPESDLRDSVRELNMQEAIRTLAKLERLDREHPQYARVLWFAHVRFRHAPADRIGMVFATHAQRKWWFEQPPALRQSLPTVAGQELYDNAMTVWRSLNDSTELPDHRLLQALHNDVDRMIYQCTEHENSVHEAKNRKAEQKRLKRLNKRLVG